ncbi:MAG: hypothetical protein HLX50_14365 [Alteromonadaceae bacterium]|nr:hypothetical protein [Alteromonadaceae bacterium]
MRNKFNTKLYLKPEQHRQFRLFMMNECNYLVFEDGLEEAVRLSLGMCENKKFREQFLELSPPSTGADEGAKDYIYWLDSGFKQPIAEMCAIFRKEFGLSTITFGRNGFLYRAICYFVKTKSDA